jgi:hypothetical protein
MNPRAHSITVAAALVLLSGCASPPISPREAFLASVRNERTNYVQLYEVSVESLREREDKLLSVTAAIISGVRESSKRQTNSPALEERLQRIGMVAETLHKSALKKLAELERMYDPSTDCILFFRYDSGAQGESGFLITHGGKVKRRLVFGENWISDSPTNGVSQ